MSRTSSRRPRRLLCVVPYPANVGFAWNFIEGLYASIADRIAAAGGTTHVAYTELDSDPRPLVGSAARAIQLDVRMQSWKSIRSTLREVRRREVNVVYFTDLGIWHWAFPLLRLAGVEWIVAHDHTSGHRESPVRIKRLLKRLWARTPGVIADRILTVSEYVSARHRDVSMLPPERIFTVLNGLDAPSDEVLAMPSTIEMRDLSRPVIACICRAAPEKGVDVLLKAFDRLVERWGDAPGRPLLLYAGDGPSYTALEELRRSLGSAGDISLLGYRNDVAEILKLATICVVPSLWEDACPLSVLEAMAYGKPVIASRVGGVPEQINSPDVGVLVPKGDAAALASAIEGLLMDAHRREAIGRAARQRILWELTRDRQVAEIFRHLTDGPS